MMTATTKIAIVAWLISFGFTRVSGLGVEWGFVYASLIGGWAYLGGRTIGD